MCEAGKKEDFVSPDSAGFLPSSKKKIDKKTTEPPEPQDQGLVVLFQVPSSKAVDLLRCFAATSVDAASCVYLRLVYAVSMSYIGAAEGQDWKKP